MLIRAINEDLFKSYSDDIPNFLKQIFASRNIKEDDLDLSIKNLIKPDFLNLDKALRLLENALIKQKKILIISDFDADGATACAVSIRALKLMGAKHIDFLVPNRMLHGYGLSKKIVDIAYREKHPDLIITVDNGIANIDGVELCHKYNIKVIITDHHLPANELPNADAIINPNIDKNSKLKNLAGVGVSFYLFASLKTYLINKNYFNKNNITIPNLISLLDLVALGTVADVVKLDRNNRILVNEGTKIIKNNKSCQGIKALLDIAKINHLQFKASQFGFNIAPRINAAGRLSDISRGIRLLLTDDISIAKIYALELEELNIKRREKQAETEKQAEEILITEKIKSDNYSISLYSKNWHEGIIGIVAGKLKDKYKCPACVFATTDGKYLKGSIRSISNVHIKDLLDMLDRKYPKLIESFGGHAMAAGLTIKKNDFEKFSKIFDKLIKKWLDNTPPNIEILTDGSLKTYDITLENSIKIDQAGPWGSGFEEPCFYGNFEILNQQTIAEKHLKLQLKTSASNAIFNAIYFNSPPFDKTNIDIVYKLATNEYMGQTSLQLLIIEELN